VKNKQKYTSYV